VLAASRSGSSSMRRSLPSSPDPSKRYCGKRGEEPWLKGLEDAWVPIGKDVRRVALEMVVVRTAGMMKSVGGRTHSNFCCLLLKYPVATLFSTCIPILESPKATWVVALSHRYCLPACLKGLDSRPLSTLEGNVVSAPSAKNCAHDTHYTAQSPAMPVVFAS
jgi:hypothetical protein